MTIPTSIPDLGFDGLDAVTLLGQSGGLENSSQYEPVLYDVLPYVFSGQAYNKPKTAEFARQALAVLLHESYGNTNPWHEANVYHVAVDGDNVVAWSDKNPGPTV